jgi:signal transduction histidine kinase/ligand-binding sensor domain-containing protein/ActR/RegA family two-component response regulator
MIGGFARRPVLTSIVLLSAASNAAAQRYNFKTFTQSDGLTDITISSFLQDQTGFLWIGTNNGLFRYDGHRFVRFGREAGLPSASISSLVETKDGTLWVGTLLSGVSRMSASRFVQEDLKGSRLSLGPQSLARDPFGQGLFAAAHNGLVRISRAGRSGVVAAAGHPVWSVFSEPGKGVWYATSDEICLWNGTAGQCYGHATGIKTERWGGLAVDREGTLWVRSATDLMALAAGAAQFESRNEGLPPASFNGAVCLDSGGRVMIPTDDGLARRGAAGWSRLSETEGMMVASTAWAMDDRDGSLWIGMRGGGLSRWLGSEEWESWTSAQGLDNDQVFAIARDHAGALLIGTGSGLNRLYRGRIEHVPVAGPPPATTRVRAIAVDAANNIWMGTSSGLVMRGEHNGRITRFDAEAGMPVQRILSLRVDRQGGVWVGAANGLFRGAATAGKWVWSRQPIPGTNESEVFADVVEDRKGRIWAAGSEGLAVWNGKKWMRVADGEGRRTLLSSSLAESGDGSIWVAYRDTVNIDRVDEDRDGTWKTTRVLSERAVRGAPDTNRFLGFDRAGNLWCGTGRGVVVRESNNRWNRYTRRDGMAWDDTGENAFLDDPDGSVWLGTSRGLTHHRPFARRRGAPPRPPLIVGVEAGGKAQSLDKPLRIDTRAGTVTFNYASLSFLNEQDIRFLYRLQGEDAQWALTSEWQASYVGLRPGSYVFEVAAASWDGQPSGRTALIPVTLTGPWWSSSSFYTGAALLFAATVFAWWFHVRQAEKALRRAKEAAESAREAAEAANRAKSVFLANMSHEIRTPLNAVLGYSQLMLRDPAVNRGARDSLNIINRSGEHLLTLINDILDMSKIEAGRVTVTPAVFDLFELLSDLEMMFRLRADARDLTFQVLVESPCETCIEADKGKLRQVLVNILGNAIKFTETGSVTLRISMKRRADESLRMFFAVEDTGPGIAPEEQRELFRPFAQSESGRRNKGGTGLGLAISRELVRLMGGDIMLKSEPGNGSTFCFEIPIRSGAGGTIPPETDRRRVIGLRPGTEAPRVLVVDDEPNNRGWLTSLLTTVGFAVREAENGEAGIRLWQDWRPRLILMDMRMPVMDGMEATRGIRALPGGRETVIFALTAGALEENRQAAMDSGVDDFVSKPFSADELLLKTQRYLSLEFHFEEGSPPGREWRRAGQATETDVCRNLPTDLIAQLQHAVANGEKDLIDDLIERAAERDGMAARILRQLADDYEYDALTHLLEEVRA